MAAVLRCHVSDHFPICLIKQSLKFLLKNKIVYIYKRLFNEKSIVIFRKNHFETDQQEIATLQNLLDVHTCFLEQFLPLHDSIFPLKKSK